MGRVLLAHVPTADLDEYLASQELERMLPITVTDAAELRAELNQVRAFVPALQVAATDIGLGRRRARTWAD